jgi:hypothetical protein
MTILVRNTILSLVGLIIWLLHWPSLCNGCILISSMRIGSTLCCGASSRASCACLRRACDEGQQGAFLVSDWRGSWKLRQPGQCLSLAGPLHDRRSRRPWLALWLSGSGHVSHWSTTPASLRAGSSGCLPIAGTPPPEWPRSIGGTPGGGQSAGVYPMEYAPVESGPRLLHRVARERVVQQALEVVPFIVTHIDFPASASESAVLAGCGCARSPRRCP